MNVPFSGRRMIAVATAALALVLAIPGAVSADTTGGASIPPAASGPIEVRLR